MKYDYNEKLPLYTIFILLLIISSNYIDALIPCKIDNFLRNNIYMKHFLCFLTMIFFIIISTNNFEDESLVELLKKAFILYFIFLLLIKNNYYFFIVNLILLGILYLVSLKKLQLLAKLRKYDVNNVNNVNNVNDGNNIKKEISIITNIFKYLSIIILVSIVIGFLIYFYKKYNQYQDKFNLIVFLLGKIKCKL